MSFVGDSIDFVKEGIGNPFANDEPSDEVSASRARRQMARMWDGNGAPPSRQIAIAYLVANSHGTLNLAEAERIVGDKGTLTSVGRKIREALAEADTKFEAWKKDYEKKHPEPVDTDEKLKTALEDGKVDAEEADELTALIGGDIADPNAVDPRGAPLWRYSGSEENLAELTVKDRSRAEIDQGERDGRRGRPWEGNTRVGARYFEQDTLEPLKWSAEQRADLQRVLSGIGLYGEKPKIRLGSWTKRDQALYAELLASANEEGLTWKEMLAKWKRNPPEDLLEELGAASGERERAPLVIRKTNATDLEQAAVQVSREMIGRVDRDFANSVAAPYNALEAQAQTAAYNAEESGGTVTDAPSPTAFMADRLERTDATEVDSYSTLGAFNEILRQLGLAG